jgi:hypothetical protein
MSPFTLPDQESFLEHVKSATYHFADDRSAGDGGERDEGYAYLDKAARIALDHRYTAWDVARLTLDAGGLVQPLSVLNRMLALAHADRVTQGRP